MKVYVMMFGIANIVAGGPIYNVNKIEYLEKHGWNVIVFPIDDGDIYIEPLKKYSGQSYEFIKESVSVFSKQELENKLSLLVSKIDRTCDEIIIETGTDYTALWGELLARELKAKHFIMFLDEKNPNVNKDTYAFYKFKYDRKELASISLKSLDCIFGKYFELHNKEEHVLKACCTNSVKNIECKWLDSIPDADYAIGSIGRIEKAFVPVIVEGICEFSRKVPEKKIAVVFFGDASNEEAVTIIKEKIEKNNNIQMFITGYMWPIPEEAIKKMNVFVSGAGSARVSANCGITTIRMDVINNVPIGFVKDAKNYKYLSLNKHNATVCDYLDEVLLKGTNPEICNKMSIDEQMMWINECFDQHMRFIKNSISEKNYYQVEKLCNKSGKFIKFYIKKIIIHIWGYDGYIKLKNKICRCI